MQKFDLTLTVVIFALCIFGWMMVASLSGPASYEIYVARGINCASPDINCNNLFMWKHFWHMILGFGICFASIFIPYKFWKTLAPLIYIGALFLLLFVLFSTYGAQLGTFAKSWINISFLPAFQPSEFAKIAIILYLANWMSRRSEQIRTFKEGLIPFAILTSIIVIPIIRQPDYGSALIVAIIAASIFFLAGAKISHLITGAIIVSLLSSLIISINPYLQERFLARFNPPLNCELNECYQSYQSLIAIGSGGMTGVGYNSSRQKHKWLPEVETDYIFAGTAEELGFFRVIWLVLAYVYICYRGFLISQNAPDRFARLTAMGITIAIVSQAFLNIAVNLDLMPVTGITLPLISHGGSSLLASLWGIGILLNISRHAKPETAHLNHRRRVRGAYHSQPRYHR
jgi:cell division protein FtsW